MRPKKPRSIAKAVFAIFIASLLASSAFLPTCAQAQKFKVLHTFHGWNGAEPVGGLVRDAAGNIYGTTGVGGTGNCSGGTGCGTAFKLNNSGQQIWLHKFNGRDGAIPVAGLLRGSSGNLFGTTLEGGDLSCNSPYGCGTVFTLDKTGQKETVLHKFTGAPDGWDPEAPLVRDGAGNLYGTTDHGGTDTQGTVFTIDTAGRETILHSFTGPPEGGGDGAFADAGVTRDAAGNLYGVTFAGGAYGAGAVYEVNSGGEEMLLYSFPGGSDGAQPDSVLLLDSSGNFYGTTENGGNGQCGGTGCGVVFKLSPQSGGGWIETVLYDFCSLTGCADGEEPGRLAMDAAGNLYGTTVFGGTHGDGVVYKLDAARNESVLHSFTGGTDGAIPAAVTMGPDGSLYGVTVSGGDLKCLPKYGGCGVVFKITP
jgi:uncharacterized repeat protein (TIGR03803 family)